MPTMPATPAVPASPKPFSPGDAEFDAAFELLSGVFDPTQADTQFPRRANAVYTASVILWMLTFQRMHPDKSLEATVKHLLNTQPTLLPKNKRVHEGTLSTNTSSYSDARQWLPIKAVEWFANHVTQSLMGDTPLSWGTRRVYLIDGTTIALAPEPALQAQFPPAANQHASGTWPLAQLVVAHELCSGLMTVPEVGAKAGKSAVSETALVGGVMDRLPADSVVMADAGYGIFSVAWAAHRRGLGFVFRLTNQRFEAYRRNARLVASGEGWSTWDWVWRPSDDEREKHTHLPEDAAIAVRIHQQRLPSGAMLAVVTDQSATTAEVSVWYEQRVRVEVDIRNVKVVMNLEHQAVRSVEMFRKELLMSVVAYNLVCQFRRQAAAAAGCEPRKLSFKRVWTTFRVFLLNAMFRTAAEWRAKYEEALKYAQRDRLPKRPPGRQYKREAYRRSAKCERFERRPPRPSKDETSEKPPATKAPPT